MSLRAVDPVPLSDEEVAIAESDSSDSVSASSTKSPKFGISSTFNIRRMFYKAQKWSAIVFSGFVGIHLFNMIVIPNFSAILSIINAGEDAFDTISLADDFMMMFREIYQNSWVEKWLLFGSLSLHILSGMSLRIYNSLKSSAFKNKRRGNNNNNNNDEILLQKSVKKAVHNTATKHKTRNDDYLINDDSIGLNGFNSLINKYVLNSPSSLFIISQSKISRYFFNLNPIQFSGYILIIPLTFHVIQLRIIPLFLHGDSSTMDLTFFKFAINEHNSAFQNILLFSGYGALIYSATYHIVSGWFKFTKVYSLKKKFNGYLSVIAVTVAGLLSVLSLSKDDVSVILDKKVFTEYLHYFH